MTRDTSSAMVPCLHAATPSRMVFFISERSRGRLADQRFQSLEAEHLVVFVKDFFKPVRVENQPITGIEVDFFGGFGWRCFRETAKNAALRIDQPDFAV